MHRRNVILFLKTTDSSRSCQVVFKNSIVHLRVALNNEITKIDIALKYPLNVTARSAQVFRELETIPPNNGIRRQRLVLHLVVVLRAAARRQTVLKRLRETHVLTDHNRMLGVLLVPDQRQTQSYEGTCTHDTHVTWVPPPYLVHRSHVTTTRRSRGSAYGFPPAPIAGRVLFLYTFPIRSFSSRPGSSRRERKRFKNGGSVTSKRKCSASAPRRSVSAPDQ